MWTYRCYDTGGKETLWKAWYDSLDDAAQARHDSVFDTLEQREPKDWRSPFARPLAKDIIEIKIGTDVEWRLLGCYAPGRTFVVVLPCNHKGKVYFPHNAIKTAQKRKNEIDSGKAKAIPCVRPR